MGIVTEISLRSTSDCRVGIVTEISLHSTSDSRVGIVTEISHYFISGYITDRKEG